jgi:hypothetical protein
MDGDTGNAAAAAAGEGAGAGKASEGAAAAANAADPGTATGTGAPSSPAPSAPAAAAAGGAKPADGGGPVTLTREELKALLKEELATFQKPVTDAAAELAAAKKSLTVAAARQEFLRANAPHMPAAYQALIPNTDDPKELGRALMAADQTIQNDLKTILLKWPNGQAAWDMISNSRSGTRDGGRTPGEGPAPSSSPVPVTAEQKIAAGLAARGDSPAPVASEHEQARQRAAVAQEWAQNGHK